MSNDNKNAKNYSDILGRTVGGILLTCVAVCITAVVVALTVKFVGWIF